MKKQHLLALLLGAISASHLYANTLIITRGPVCMGLGGYLSNAIKSIDDSYNTFSHVDISNALYYQVLNALFPQQMTIISQAIDQENISYAITNYRIYFKDTAYEYQKQQTLDAITQIRDVLNDPVNEKIYTALIAAVKHLVTAELAYHAACKHNVVVESGTIINCDHEITAIKDLFDTTVETLNYCSPTTMIEQWQQKETLAINQKKAWNRRTVKQVLQTFFNNFTPTDNEKDAVVLLTKDEFDAIIDQAATYIETVPYDELGENGIFTRTEFTLKELADFKEKTYVQCNFYEVDSVALVPSLTYDMLLSSKEDCLNLAQRIANGEF